MLDACKKRGMKTILCDSRTHWKVLTEKGEKAYEEGVKRAVADFGNHAGETIATVFENGGSLVDNGGYSKSITPTQYAAEFAVANAFICGIICAIACITVDAYESQPEAPSPVKELIDPNRLAIEVKD